MARSYISYTWERHPVLKRSNVLDRVQSGKKKIVPKVPLFEVKNSIKERRRATMFFRLVFLILLLYVFKILYCQL